jgi:hypothetical protein
MRNKILELFIKKKEKKIINNSIIPNDRQPNDDLQSHLLQKPIKTGYSHNNP